jgi:hypothetical protein
LVNQAVHRWLLADQKLRVIDINCHMIEAIIMDGS